MLAEFDLPLICSSNRFDDRTFVALSAPAVRLTPARHRAEGSVQQQGGPGGRRLLANLKTTSEHISASSRRLLLRDFIEPKAFSYFWSCLLSLIVRM